MSANIFDGNKSVVILGQRIWYSFGNIILLGECKSA